jgi:hypothetical protein
MRSPLAGFWTLFAVVVILWNSTVQAAENTIVVSVTVTTPNWNQSLDQITNWHTNTSIKDAPGYGVYDIEIGRSNNSVSYLSLYRFTDDVRDPRVEPWALAAFNAYKQSKLIRKIELINPNNLPYWDAAISAQVRDALKVFNTLIAEREPNPSRFVLCFLSGGGPGIFFADQIQYYDSLDYMRHLRTSFPDSTIVGDFSTNCNNGYFDWVAAYAPYCDVILSSEKDVGGFQPNDRTNFSHFHLRNYHHFWATNVPTSEALDRIVANRQAWWLDSSIDIVAKKVEQSIAVYTSAHLRPLAHELAQNSTFKARQAEWVASKNSTYWMTDLGAFVYETKDPALTARFEAFRSKYASTRDQFTWQGSTFGCSIFSKIEFQKYVNAVNSAPTARVPATVGATRGGPVAIDGSASSDSNLDPITYRWTQVSGPSVTLRNADRPRVDFTAPAASSATELEFELVVGDGLLSSAPARVKVALADADPAANPGRLINLSVLSPTGPGSQLLTVGFVLGGSSPTGTQKLLLRGGGPSLASFNVGTPLADPTLTLFRGQTATASNDDWGFTTSNQTSVTSALAASGAFPFASASSKDAALVQTLSREVGSYTMQLASKGAATGTVLAEVYDLTSSAAFSQTKPRLINVSCLQQVPANDVLTAGFVIGGSTPLQVLIRVSGPSLAGAPFNVPGTLADPRLTVFNAQRVAIASNAGWEGSTAITAANAATGAFAFTGPNSKDSAVVLTLNPGLYTVQASSVTAKAGVVLIEVYGMPASR